MVYLEWKGGLNSIFVDDENTSQGGGGQRQGGEDAGVCFMHNLSGLGKISMFLL